MFMSWEKRSLNTWELIKSQKGSMRNSEQRESGTHPSLSKALLDSLSVQPSWV